jgi:hypothetical protein
VVEEMHRRMPPSSQGADDGLGLGLSPGDRLDGLDDAPRYGGEALATYKRLVRRGMEDFLARALVDEAQRHGAGARPGAI